MLRTAVDVPRADRVWLATDDPAAAADRVAAAEPGAEVDPSPVAILSRFSIPATVALIAGALGALLFALVGIAAATEGLVRSRRDEILVLRALGAEQGLQQASLRGELVAALVYAVAVGAIAALATAIVTVPALAHAADPGAGPALQPSVRVDPFSLVAAALVLAAAIAVAFVVLSAAVKRAATGRDVRADAGERDRRRGAGAMTRLSGPRLVRRALREAGGVSALLAVVVAAGTLLAVGAPRELDQVLTSALHADLARAGSGALALEAIVPQDLVFTNDGAPSSPRCGRGSGSAFVRCANDSEGLDPLVGPGAYVGQAAGSGQKGFDGSGTATSASNALFRFDLEAAPGLRSDARLVSGTWPGRFVEGKPIQVVMSAKGAAAMKWRVGQTQTLQLGIPETAVLVGTVAPRDPASAFWSLQSDRSVAAAQPSGDGTFITYRSTDLGRPCLLAGPGRPSSRSRARRLVSR